MTNPKPRAWPEYAERGYNSWDGLGEGRWVTKPGSAGLTLVWVGELERAPDRRRRPLTGRCVECGTDIGARAQRCRSCHGRVWNAGMRDAAS